MPSTTVSRWTMLYFAAALTALILAQLMMVAGWSYPARAIEAPETLIAVHLVTIGWLSLLMLGALCQFVPVIVDEALANDRLALAALAAIILGLGLLLAGFAGLGGIVAAPDMLMPAGGVLLLAGFAASVGNLGVVLWRGRPLPLPAQFVVAGLAALLVTGTLGLIFALGFAMPGVATPLAPLVAQGLPLHLIAGLGGWLTLTAIGVSYRLLSMFMLAPEEHDGTSRWVLGLTVVGLLLWWAAGLSAAYGVPTVLPAAQAGEALTLLGWLLYAIDVARLYQTRKRRRLELNSIAAAAAIACLVIATLLLAVLTTERRAADFAGPLAYLFGFGWLSGLGLSQLYKIVPFLTWLRRFGPLLGRGPVPRVQDLVDEKRAAPCFALYFAAVLVGTACGFLGWTELWRVAIGGQLAATLAIAVELWRAAHPKPFPAAPVRGRPFPLPKGEAR